MRRLKEMIGYRSAEESGFTLIEMLIVVGIIVALAAAIVPNVVQFGGKGEEGQRDQEKSAVQTAMDSMMADKGVSSVSLGPTTAENDFTVYPTGTVAGMTIDGYLRVTPTEYFYCWTTGGVVKQNTLTTDVC